MINYIVFGILGQDENLCDRGYYAKKIQDDNNKKVYTLSKGSSVSNANDLTLTVQLLDLDNIQVTINDSSNRFQVPKSTLKNEGPSLKKDSNSNLDDYVTVTSNSSKFALSIHEFQNTNSVYFQINADGLTFSDYYISLETSINTNGKLYGVGERVTDFFLSEGIYTSWSFDTPDPIDDGKIPGKNVYGTHPVYFTQSKSGKKYHWGMFNLNSDAQDTKIKYVGALGGQISHYISGNGIFDMYFFIENNDPESAIKKYHYLIGNSLLPPFWSLGWHQCKYGYKDTATLQAVYDNYTASNFPLDTLWSDIDHMYKYRDFTYDKDGNYKGLDTFIKNTLHANNRKYVPIIDAGIAIASNDNYTAFDTGLAKGVFIKSGNPNRNGKTDIIKGMGGILYGKVWPGYAAFPDWTHANATGWWVDSIKAFHNEIEFDGIWLDMNEAANF